MHSIGRDILERDPSKKVLYVTSETFTNELIDALKSGKSSGSNESAITAFREKYRNIDVLLIDDIQFIIGKESTQEEFFHTFNHLHAAHKHIIISSDKPPKDIETLEARLRTRFEGGLIADVQPPSFELRTAIIRKKSGVMNISISNELVDYMAERLQHDIRQIEGVIKKLHAMFSMTGISVSKESIDRVISVIDPGNIPTGAMVEKILSSVSKSYGVPIEDIKSKKKTENIANARHTSIYIIRSMTNLSLKEIGNILDITKILEKDEKQSKITGRLHGRIVYRRL